MDDAAFVNKNKVTPERVVNLLIKLIKEERTDDLTVVLNDQVIEKLDYRYKIQIVQTAIDSKNTKILEGVVDEVFIEPIKNGNIDELSNLLNDQVIETLDNRYKIQIVQRAIGNNNSVLDTINEKWPIKSLKFDPSQVGLFCKYHVMHFNTLQYLQKNNVPLEYIYSGNVKSIIRDALTLGKVEELKYFFNEKKSEFDSYPCEIKNNAKYPVNWHKATIDYAINNNITALIPHISFRDLIEKAEPETIKQFFAIRPTIFSESNIIKYQLFLPFLAIHRIITKYSNNKYIEYVSQSLNDHSENLLKEDISEISILGDH